MKPLRIILTIGAGLFLISILSFCHTPSPTEYYPFHKDRLSKGISPDSVRELLILVPMAVRYNYPTRIYEEGDVRLDVYKLGDSKYRYDIYYYKDRRLVFWGDFDDFMTHASVDIRSVGKKASKMIKEIIDD